MPSGIYERTEYHKNILRINGNSGRFMSRESHRGWKGGISLNKRGFLKNWRHKKGISRRYYNSEHRGISYTPEYIKEKRKQYRIKNRERINERNRLWKKTPKGRLLTKQWNAIFRARTKDLTLKTVQLVYEDNIKQYGTLTCYLCLKPIEFGKDHLEHKIPLSRGGTNLRDNLDIAHSVCNLKKHNKTEVEFKEE